MSKSFIKADPLVGSDLHRLWQVYLASGLNDKKDIKQLLSLLTEQKLQEGYAKESIVLSPPSKNLSYGKILLGDIYYGTQKLYPFGLRDSEMNSHVGIFGRTGSGKSSLITLLLWNFYLFSIPFLLFDWKQEYSKLNHILTLKILQAHGDTPSFCWNPFIPPNLINKENYQNYIKDIASLFVTSFFPGMSLLSIEGIKVLFIDHVNRLCERIGAYEGKRFPTLKLLYETLPSSGSLAYAYPALKSCLQTLCLGTSGKIFNKSSVSLGQLLEKPAIIEFGAGAETDKRFLANMILYWIYHHRLMEGKTKKTKHVLILEEAHHHQGELIEKIFRMIRAYGQSLIFVDQHPSLIKIPIFGNMYTTICLNLKDDQDITKINNSMMLEEKDSITKLTPGQAIIKLQARYPKPFLIHFPMVNIPEIKSILNPKSFLAQDELRFLLNVSEHPELTIVKRYNMLDLNPRKGSQFQKRLIERGLVISTSQKTSKGKVTLLKLTNKGKKIAQEHGSRKTLRHGNGKHKYAISFVKNKLEKQGLQVEYEFSLGGGKTIDLFLQKHNIAIEIETGASNFKNNINKCLEANLPVLIVATDIEIKNRIQLWIREQNLSKDKVQVVSIETNK